MKALKSIVIFIFCSVALIMHSCSSTEDNIALENKQNKDVFSLHIYNENTSKYIQVSHQSFLKIVSKRYEVEIDKMGVPELRINTSDNGEKFYSIVSGFASEKEVEGVLSLVTTSVGAILEKIEEGGANDYVLRPSYPPVVCTCDAIGECSYFSSSCKLETDSWGCYCTNCPVTDLSEGYCKRSETTDGKTSWYEEYISALQSGTLSKSDFL